MSGLPWLSGKNQWRLFGRRGNMVGHFLSGACRQSDRNSLTPVPHALRLNPSFVLRPKALPLCPPPEVRARTLLNDSAIRRALCLSLQTSLREGELLLEELGLCEHTARADVAVLGDRFQGFEIKGETDSLRRLSTQLDVYQQVFDSITVVTTEGFLQPVKKVVPRSCGIICATMTRCRVILNTVRPAVQQNQTDPANMVQLLWREEALAILDGLGAISDFKRRPRAVIWQEVVDQLSLTELRAAIVTALSLRSAWKSSDGRRNTDGDWSQSSATQ
jgi:hypothetical protein